MQGKPEKFSMNHLRNKLFHMIYLLVHFHMIWSKLKDDKLNVSGGRSEFQRSNSKY